MQAREKIINCYNKTAELYAQKFIDELSKKHLDRILLSAFAKENSHKGKMIDLGCGPGQTTKFLLDEGVKDILGTDISDGMIEKAKTLFPNINFETADMLQLKYADNSFSAAIAFYAIVHFSNEKLKIAFKEIHRVLKNKGQFLFSFHVGDEIIRNPNFLEVGGEIDFHFFETESVLALLDEVGFSQIDFIERLPYPDVEYPSKRAYIWVEKN